MKIKNPQTLQDIANFLDRNTAGHYVSPHVFRQIVTILRRNDDMERLAHEMDEFDRKLTPGHRSEIDQESVLQWPTRSGLYLIRVTVQQSKEPIIALAFRYTHYPEIEVFNPYPFPLSYRHLFPQIRVSPAPRRSIVPDKSLADIRERDSLELAPSRAQPESASEKAIVRSAAGMVAVAAAMKVIRDLIGSAKDWLDIRKHLRENAKRKRDDEQ